MCVLVTFSHLINIQCGYCHDLWCACQTLIRVCGVGIIRCCVVEQGSPELMAITGYTAPYSTVSVLVSSTQEQLWPYFGLQLKVLTCSYWDGQHDVHALPVFLWPIFGQLTSCCFYIYFCVFQHWLDPMKPIKKQVKSECGYTTIVTDDGLFVLPVIIYIIYLLGKAGDFSFRFRVKLYPVSSTYIFDEVTRYIDCVCHMCWYLKIPTY